MSFDSFFALVFGAYTAEESYRDYVPDLFRPRMFPDEAFVRFLGFENGSILFDLVVWLVQFYSMYNDEVLGAPPNFMVFEMFAFDFVGMDQVICVGVEFKIRHFLVDGSHDRFV